MTKQELVEIARKNNLGGIHFQYNIAQNTGKEFEVGYVFEGGKINGKMILFCKRNSNSTENDFHLCNEFRLLES